MKDAKEINGVSKECVVVPLKEKLFFGSADLYGGGAQALITAVYFVFLTLNGVPVGLAGLIVAISKVWDAVSDPLMGVISDNTRTKWGRRRPFIFAGSFLVIVAFALLFMPLFSIENTIIKFLVYLFAYLFYSTLSTMINVPYSSMSTEISPDYNEKTKVNTIRLIFSMASGGISAVVPLLLVDSLQSGKIAIPVFSVIMTLGFGLFYGIPLFLAGVKCKERLPLPSVKSKFSFKTFLKPLKVRAFVYLLFCYLFAFTCMDIISTNVIFFARYSIDFEYPTFLILAVLMLAYAATVPVHSWLLKKGKDKPFLFRVGIPIYILGVIALCLLPSTTPGWIVLAMCVLIGVGMSGSQMMPWILFPDIVDVAELKLNDRPTGSFSGLMTFVRKSTAALAIWLSSMVLGWTGFIEPAADKVTGIIPEVIQPNSAVWGIRLVIMFSVIIFMSLAFVAAKKLKLTPARSAKVTQFLVLQNEGKLNEENLSTEDWEEYQKIKQELF